MSLAHRLGSRLVAPRADARATSTAVAAALIGGVQLVMLGVIGEYVGDIHAEVKGRPLDVAGRLENFAEVPELPPRAVVARERAPV